MSSGPVVALIGEPSTQNTLDRCALTRRSLDVIGPNGFLGSSLLHVFVEATKNGEFQKLKIVSSRETEGTKKAVADVPGGKVETFVLVYSDKAALVSALNGVDVLVSALGGHGAQAPLEHVLAEAGKYLAQYRDETEPWLT